MGAPDAAETQASVAAELGRVARRWQQLPLDRALAASGGVLALVQDLADEVAARDGLQLEPVPDLGPAVLIDQLRVMVFDHQRAGLDPATLASRLATLRQSIC